MIDWQLICLAAMAVAMVVMAGVQVAVLVAVSRSARQVAETSQEIRREIRPLMEKVHRIADDAARATAVTVAQVERVDRLMTSTCERLDETLNIVQGVIVEPVRQGAAVMAAVRAALAVFRGPRDAHHGRDEEEALFVG